MVTKITKEETKVQLFSKDEFGAIRTVMINGEPWFVAKDVCDILGTTNPTMAMNGLEDFERAKFNLGRQGEANIISESGFYALVLRSRKPIAKPFRIWVTSEVLPSIRKTGQYIANPANKMEMLLEDMQQRMEVQAVQINDMEDLLAEQSEKLDAVMDNMTLTTVQQGRLHRAVKDRINYLLGGAHSQGYKDNSKLYFLNLWNNLKETFHCGSRWQDLNPKYYNQAFDFVSEWQYKEI